MLNFLVVYDRRRGKLVGEPREFEDAAEAMRARFTVERAQETDYEVVVLSGESEAAIRRTHARYFESAPELCLRLLATCACRPAAVPGT